MIRAALGLITLAAMTIWCGSRVMIARTLGQPDVHGGLYDRMLHLWSRSVCRVVGAEVVVHGHEYVAGVEPRVFVANHVSWFDIFALGQHLPHQKFVAKAELRNIPFFGWVAGGWGIVWVERENRKSALAAYEKAGEQIRAGVSVGVFPEGTRGDAYPLRAFKKGPFVLAIAGQVPVVPTLIYGSREIHARSGVTVRPGTIHVHFLPPISSAGLQYDDRDELARQARDAMAACLEREYGIRSVPSHKVRPVLGVSPEAPGILPST